MRKGFFNTGRSYSAYGQRISWLLINEMLYFKDHDRNIEGRVAIACPPGTVLNPLTDSSIANRLMREYDNCAYEGFGPDEYIIRPLLELEPITVSDLITSQMVEFPNSELFEIGDMLALCAEHANHDLSYWVALCLSHLERGPILFYRTGKFYGCRFGIRPAEYLSGCPVKWVPY